MFVYIAGAAPVRQSTITGTGIRRATATRIREAREQITAAIRSNPPQIAEGNCIGEIAMNVWSRNRARESNPGPIQGLPENNTFRQATRLDHLRQNHEQGDNEWAEVPIRYPFAYTPVSVGIAAFPVVRRRHLSGE